MRKSHPRGAISALSFFAFIAASALSASAHDGHVHKSPTAPAEKDATSTTSRTREPSLAEVHQATERFRDVNVALAEGYLRDSGDVCDTAEMMGKPAELGAMGIHFFRPDLLGITAPPNSRIDGNGTHTDFWEPAILIYEPQADGSLELVAVENLVFRKSWHAAGNSTLPTFHGVAYDTMADDPTTAVDEAHMFEPHYDRHVWIYRENPNGVFAPFNPNVTCKHHRGGSHQHANR
ncbi:hypothetical protein [Microvirga sp. 2TAF3]|uniref:hypothetical protein n=1 Tax=Microvirga sp. 2TAF3 TaxID=3233014 RepID=UPI003F9C3BA5